MLQQAAKVHAGECPIKAALPVRILDDLQRLFIVMTVNSVVPTFANHEFCARRPPFGHEPSVRDLPMMPFIRYSQRQAPLLAPPANFRLLFQVRGQTTPMTRPEVLAAVVGNNAASAGAHTVSDRSLSTHWQKSPARVFL
jgi:hypothetical protein